MLTGVEISVILKLSNKRKDGNNMTLEQKATQTLFEAGVPCNLFGFKYLRAAIVLCCADTEKLNALTKVLYPEISKMYKLGDWRRVERCMRSALMKSNHKNKANGVFLSEVVWKINEEL